MYSAGWAGMDRKLDKLLTGLLQAHKRQAGQSSTKNKQRDINLKLIWYFYETTWIRFYQHSRHGDRFD
jgi:hypothetical protein